MKEINNYIKENDTDNVEIEKLKQIIQTLSKEIPNSEDEENKHYLDEFNKIGTIVEALELLNKRLKDFVPRERKIKYNPHYSNGTEFDVEYVDGTGVVTPNSREFDIVIHSLYMNWRMEYDTSGWDYQYRQAFIPVSSLTFKTNNTKLSTSGAFKNSLYLGEIDEGDTWNYTELSGYLACNVYTVYAEDGNNRINGMMYFCGNKLYLYCDNWSWLSSSDTIIEVTFSGTVLYNSYEDYRTD